jgi:hypothetical protein
MKRYRMGRAGAAVLTLALGPGCAHKTPPPQPASEKESDMLVTDGVRDAQVRAAIVAQHTLFPYHFAEGGEELNDLGRADLSVLAQHLRSQGGGELNVRRGPAAELLYSARVVRVREALRAEGVDVAKVRIADNFAGADGMSSTDVARALSSEQGQKAFQPADQSSSGSDRGTPANAANNSTGGGRQ